MSTEQEVLNRIDKLSDATDWNDTNVYAEILGSADDVVPDPPPQFKGETEQPQEPKAPEASKESSEAPAAAAVTEPPPEQPAGVATKDGKHVLPFAVLKETREGKQVAEAKAAALAERNAALEAELAQVKAGKASVIADIPAHSDEEIERAATDFPELAATMRNNNLLRATVMQMSERMAALQQPAPAQTQPDQGDPIQDLIDQHPLLARWQAKGGGVWQDCIDTDKALRDDPAWATKPMAERFAEVQRRVAEDLGVSVPSATPKTTPEPTPPAVPKPIETRPSLSDLKGTPPQTTDDIWARMDPREAAAASERLSVEDIMRSVGVYQ